MVTLVMGLQIISWGKGNKTCWAEEALGLNRGTLITENIARLRQGPAPVWGSVTNFTIFNLQKFKLLVIFMI